MRFSSPPEVILQTHDVGFVQQRTHLHLDHFERKQGAIGQSVNLADRYIGVFANHQIGLASAHCDMRRAQHDQPVFGAVQVLLQTELLARMNPDALDKIARRMGHGFVPAPWPFNTFKRLGARRGSHG